jgi:imidazolonepropionase-like amidohydrolase
MASRNPTGALRFSFSTLALAAAFAGAFQSVRAGETAQDEPTAPRDLFITHATLMTVTHGTIADGTLSLHEGRIVAVGKDIAIPAGAEVIDAGGRYVTPGIVEAHAHVGMGGRYDPQDTNEMAAKPWGQLSGPVQADLRIRDSIKTDDNAFYLLLASGQTTDLELPGSANLFGGQAAPIKLKVGRSREEMFIKDAPVALKIACGDTPARVWKGKGVGVDKPEDVIVERRTLYAAAKAYTEAKAEYRRKVAAGDRHAVPPPVDLKLEAIGKLFTGEALLELHCHRAESIREEMAAAHDYGFVLRTIHHGTEAYKIASDIAAHGSGVLVMSDMWGGSPQTEQGIPWTLEILKAHGVKVLALHGEVMSVSRRLTQEAGKALRYETGAFDRNEALALVTLNAAWVFGLENRIGSLDVGKDADVVIWDGDPLSTYGHADKVFIEGRLYFDQSLPGLGLVAQDAAP